MRLSRTGSEPHTSATTTEELADQLFHALMASDGLAVGEILEEALKVMPPLECAESLFAPALNRIGDAWSEGKAALAQIYLAGRICQEQIDAILPASDYARNNSPRLGIGVLADHHVLGKRIVSSYLKLAGYPVKDYGAGLDPSSLARRAREDHLEVLLVSTLMFPSALKVEELTSLLDDHPVKVFVGGAPFNFDPELWEKVGAAGMGRSAADALTLIRDFEEGREGK